MNQAHNFQAQLDASNDARLLPFWEATYRAAFPDFRCMVDNVRDNGAQRCGVDRLVVLKSTQVLRIDEKARLKKDYGDLLIEIVSNDRTQAPGWIEKDLTIDFLAYGVVPSKRCYLFPWPTLRAAWVKHGDEWKRAAKADEDGFRVIKAQNQGYRTWSIAVPMCLAQEAIKECLVVDVSTAELHP